MIPTNTYERATENVERRYVIGNEGYLDVSWEPSEETKRELACISWTDNTSIDFIIRTGVER